MSTETEKIPSEEMQQRVRNEFPKYRIANLLWTTALVAGILATVRLLGPQKSWLVFLVAYAFAPTIAMLLFILLRRQSAAVRCGAVGLTLVVFATAMIILCGLIYGTEAMQMALVGTLIEWPGQVAILLSLHLIQRGSSCGPVNWMSRVLSHLYDR